MRLFNFKNNTKTIRVASAAVLAAFVFSVASSAQTTSLRGKYTHHDLAHYGKVAGKDTGHVAKRSAVKTARVTKRVAKRSERVVAIDGVVSGDAVKHGSEVVAHDTKVAGKKTGRFFRRVGRAIY